MLPDLKQDGTYGMTKKEVIAWMRKYGWKYGTDQLVYPWIDLPQRGPYAGQITKQDLTFIPQKFICPNSKHATNTWVFLTAMPSGVFLTCAHPLCRLTTGPLDTTKAQQGKIEIIDYETAKAIVEKTQQSGVSAKLQKWALDHAIWEE